MTLQREIIVREAVALLEEVGFDGLTVRRLAERLDVQNPALYWHFKNKQDLLNSMAALMFEDAFKDLAPPVATEAWGVWLAGVVGRLRQALLRHRDGTRVIAGANLAGSKLPAILALVIQMLEEAGFTFRTALVSTITLFDYTLGAAFEEQTEPAQGTTGPSEPQHHSALFTSRQLSTLTLASAEGATEFIQDRNAGFEAGLELIFAGMQARKGSTNG